MDVDVDVDVVMDVDMDIDMDMDMDMEWTWTWTWTRTRTRTSNAIMQTAPIIITLQGNTLNYITAIAPQRDYKLVYKLGTKNTPT